MSGRRGGGIGRGGRGVGGGGGGSGRVGSGGTGGTGVGTRGGGSTGSTRGGTGGSTGSSTGGGTGSTGSTRRITRRTGGSASASSPGRSTRSPGGSSPGGTGLSPRAGAGRDLRRQPPLVAPLVARNLLHVHVPTDQRHDRSRAQTGDDVDGLHAETPPGVVSRTDAPTVRRMAI